MKKRLCLSVCMLLVMALLLTSCQKNPTIMEVEKHLENSSSTTQNSESTSDTIKWFNATYAPLTAANKGDLNEIGGFKKNTVYQELVKKLLSSSWDVTDKASADSNLDWLLKEGHRTQYQEEIAQFEKSGLLDTPLEEIKAILEANGTDKEGVVSIIAMLNAYQKYGKNAIDAWDYCRALQCLAHYYLADYYTKEEALDKSLEIAKVLQSTYSSWEDCMQSYLNGYQYWSEDDINDPKSTSGKRLKIYQDLVASKDNPYTLDWNTKLEKSW